MMNNRDFWVLGNGLVERPPCDCENVRDVIASDALSDEGAADKASAARNDDLHGVNRSHRIKIVYDLVSWFVGWLDIIVVLMAAIGFVS